MEKRNAKMVSRESCKLTLSFEVAADEVDKAVERIFDEIQKDARVPGFRQGKAPMAIIKREFARTAEERAVNRLSANAIYGYLEDKKIRPVGAPSVTEFSYEPGKDMKFSAAVECHPEFSVKNYKKIKASRKKISVADAEIEERIKALTERNASLVSDLAGAVSKDGFAVIDYSLESDGKKLEKASAQNHLVDISNPANIKGLNDAIIGTKIGDSKEIEVPFSTDYPAPELRGKTGRLKFTVKEVKKKILPAADDAFAKDLGYENMDNLKEAVSAAMKAEREKQSRDDLRRQIDEVLLKNNPFDVPETIAADYAKSLLDTMKNYFSSNGLTEAEWNKRKQEFEKQAADEARESVRLFYVYDKIAETEKIAVTDEDVKKTRDALKSVYEKDVSAFEKRWRDDESRIKHDILREKVFKFLLAEATG
ncbi:MAG: trigger factor [Endomicrobiia bacterium]|nr:trigger factor [Endomicrobiia bacterium]